MGLQIFVFASFLMPEKMWLKLSKETEKCNVVFILKELPNNNFEELTQKIAHLKIKGMKANVQVNPRLFKQFQIKITPTFVIQSYNFLSKTTIHAGTNACDIIKGNISLKHALNMALNKA